MIGEAELEIYDLHTHTTFSDGEASVEYLIDRAHEKGYGIGISDHIFCCGNDTVEKIEQYADYVRNTEALVGVEANIGEDFSLPGRVNDKIDYVIASTHSIEEEENKYYFSSYFGMRGGFHEVYKPDFDVSKSKIYLEHLLKTIETCFRTQRVDIIGHCVVTPMYDYLKGDPYLEEWNRELIFLCKKYKVAVELCGLWKEPSEAFVTAAMKEGVQFTFGCDCHTREQACELTYPLDLVQRLGITQEMLFIPKKR